MVGTEDRESGRTPQDAYCIQADWSTRNKSDEKGGRALGKLNAPHLREAVKLVTPLASRKSSEPIAYNGLRIAKGSDHERL